MSTRPEEIWKNLTMILAEASDHRVNTDQIRPETKLESDLGLSSLMVVNLLLEIDQKFGTRVLDEKFDFKSLTLSTAGDLQTLIEARLSEAPINGETATPV